MSTSDSQFINRFSAIFGCLLVVSIGLVFLARGIAAATPVADGQEDPVLAAAGPPAPPAAAPQPPTVMTPAPAAPADTQSTAKAGAASTTESAGSADPEVALAGAAEGQAVYQQVCSVCHGLGIAGAPKMGDASAWGPRIAQGKATLYDHALHGFTGKTGVMAPKAGRGDLSDASVQTAVDYMVARSAKSGS